MVAYKRNIYTKQKQHFFQDRFCLTFCLVEKIVQCLGADWMVAGEVVNREGIDNITVPGVVTALHQMERRPLTVFISSVQFLLLTLGIPSGQGEPSFFWAAE